MSNLADEAASLAERALDHLGTADVVGAQGATKRLAAAAGAIAQSWSGSNLGYHALVYYDGWQPPRAGEGFDRQWGLSGMGMSNTQSSRWKERTGEQVRSVVLRLAGEPDLDLLRHCTRDTADFLDDLVGDLNSILSTLEATSPDNFLQSQTAKLNDMDPISPDAARAAQMPTGQIMTRDAVWDGSLRIAPHQEMLADAVAAQSLFGKLRDVANIATRVAAHLRRQRTQELSGGAMASGTRIFIGHGGKSKEWLVLQSFISERLHLLPDSFERVATPGIHTTQRLATMLDDAKFAFVILTAEDQTHDGELRARQNCVHEVGLFQGRLGIEKAIVILECGCERFSNIEGLGHIWFEKDNISSCFEDVRRVLEREGVLPA